MAKGEGKRGGRRTRCHGGGKGLITGTARVMGGRRMGRERKGGGSTETDCKRQCHNKTPLYAN